MPLVLGSCMGLVLMKVGLLVKGSRRENGDGWRYGRKVEREEWRNKVRSEEEGRQSERNGRKVEEEECVREMGGR